MTEAADAALWAAYLRTVYEAHTPFGRIAIRVGQRAPLLDQLLGRTGDRAWCFLTAWNPRSEPLSAGENAERNAELRRALDAEGYRVLADARGLPAAPSWQPEASFLVLGIERDAAIRLARRFGQNAVVWGRLGAPAELVDCRERGDAR